MIHAQLNNLIAQQLSDELQRAAEAQRLAHSIRTARRERAATRAIARLSVALRLRRPPMAGGQGATA
jgi:hypothetical protein